MYYPEELVEEIRERNDIVEVIGTYVKLQKKGSSYFGLCPFHNEKSPSFSVSPDKQMYYCFGCGAGGNVFTFIMEYENYSFPEALKYLADRVGIKLPEREYSEEEKRQQDLRMQVLEINKMAANYFYYQLRTESGAQAMQYLKSRQLDDETIKRFALGYSSKYSSNLYQYFKSKKISDELLKESGLFNVDEKNGMYDKFWNRVIFPILDVNNRVIGFGGRVMGDGKPKYLNSPETIVFDKSRNLYGLNIARAARKKYLLVCEGYMDVISMHQAGFSNAVASLGTALTEKHATLLKRYTDEVILTYDSDDAGVRAALRAIPIVKRAGLRARVLHMNPYKDPDEFIKTLGAEKFQERIDQAENSFMFEISVLERNYDMKDPEGKTSFFQAVSEKLMEFEQELERENYIQAVAEKYHIGFDNLRKMVNRSAMRAIGREVPKSAVDRERKEIRKKSQDDGMKQAQRLMLTWLIDKKGLYAKVKPYLDADDFTEDLYHQAAQLLFEQLEKSELNPARIINHFEDPETQKEVASLFHAKLNLQSQAEFDKALNETLRKIINNSIEFRTKNMNPADIAGLQKILLDRKKVQDMPKITYQM